MAKKKKKTLGELCVKKMPGKFFAIDQPVYIISEEGEKLTDVPYGSLIYTGELSREVIAGFNTAVCLVWEGKDDAKYKNVIIRKQKKD